MPAQFSPITLGRQIQTLSVCGFIVTDTEHSAGTSLPRHAHENANIALVRQGNFVETVGQRRWECRPGTAIFKPSGADHANHFSSGGTKSVLIEFPSEALELLNAATSRLTGAVVLQDSRILSLTRSLHQELRTPDASTALAVEGVVLQLLATMLRMQTPRETKAPAWLTSFRDALHDRCCETLRIGDLAQECGVHPAHAIREFRRRFGMTPADYLRRLRADRACEFLRGGMSAADAAVAAGFSHQSHFARVLRRYYGLTPYEYANGR